MRQPLAHGQELKKIAGWRWSKNYVGYSSYNWCFLLTSATSATDNGYWLKVCRKKLSVELAEERSPLREVHTSVIGYKSGSVVCHAWFLHVATDMVSSYYVSINYHGFYKLYCVLKKLSVQVARELLKKGVFFRRHVQQVELGTMFLAGYWLHTCSYSFVICHGFYMVLLSISHMPR